MTPLLLCGGWLGSKCNKEVCNMATLMWWAWRCRNLALFQNEHSNAVLLASGFYGMVSDHVGYVVKVFTPAATRVQAGSNSWVCPLVGCINANVDAHVPAIGMAGLGVIFRKSAGNIIVAATKQVAAASRQYVEALAVHYA